MKHIFLLIAFSSFISCNAPKGVNNAPNGVNTMFNENYKLSIKRYYGQLTDKEYNEIRAVLSKELNSAIPSDKSILINYVQRAPNCAIAGLNKKGQLSVINNTVQISKKISRETNTYSFFVYESNALNSKMYEQNSNFIRDSGYFYENVFSMHETCDAFYIIRPDRKFMKYYGVDYFTSVKEFLVSQ